MGKSSRVDGRKAKAAALAAENKKAERRTTLLWRIGLGVLVVALIVGVGFAVKASRPAVTSAEDLRSRVTTYTNLGRTHTTKPVDYKQVPPVGGDHNPVWQNCGAYDKPVAEENGVHSLEHGAVWLTYDPQSSIRPGRQVDRARRDEFVLVGYPVPRLEVACCAQCVGRAIGGRLRRFARHPELHQGLQTRTANA